MTAKKSKSDKTPKSSKPRKAPKAPPDEANEPQQNCNPQIPTPPIATAVEPAPASAKKMSALDAAAKVLGDDGEALGCKELVARMSARDYWSSPAGKTPEATLYSALMREINTKGELSRFKKAERGKFALNQAS